MTISPTAGSEFWESGKTLKTLAEGGYFSTEEESEVCVWGGSEVCVGWE